MACNKDIEGTDRKDGDVALFSGKNIGNMTLQQPLDDDRRRMMVKTVGAAGNNAQSRLNVIEKAFAVSGCASMVCEHQYIRTKIKVFSADCFFRHFISIAHAEIADAVDFRIKDKGTLIVILRLQFIEVIEGKIASHYLFLMINHDLRGLIGFGNIYNSTRMVRIAVGYQQRIKPGDSLGLKKGHHVVCFGRLSRIQQDGRAIEGTFEKDACPLADIDGRYFRKGMKQPEP